MASVSYNGVVFPFVLHQFYTQTAEMDPSGTDWWAMKLDMTVQSIFTADVLPLMFPDLVGKTDNAADIMMVVRSKLMKPRRVFSVTCNGVELIPTTAPDGPGNVDAQNGPRPQFCNITQMNDTSFLVTWRVEATYWENNRLELNGNPKVLNQPGNPVLYNRWSESQDMDQLMNTRWTRQGRFVIRSDNSAGSIVDKFRAQFAVVSCPPGFLRESSNYKVDPSGLALEYSQVDVQQFKMPPAPAYKASGDYTEETMRNGGQRWGTVYLRLEASNKDSQVELMLNAVAIAMAKLRAGGVQGANGRNPDQAAPPSVGPNKIGILDYLYVKTGMYENWVEVRARARMKPSRSIVKVGGKDGMDPAKVWQYNPGSYVFTPGSDGVNRQMQYIVRGTAGNPDNRILLQAAAYYDPSLRNTKVDQKTRQLNAAGQLEVGQAGKTLEA